MSSSQAPPASSLPPKPEVSTPPQAEEPRSNASPGSSRPLLSRMGPSVRYDSRDRNPDWDRENDRDRERDRFREYDRDRDGRGRGRGRGFGRGGPRREWSPRRDDRRLAYVRDRSPPPRRRDFSPPRRGGRPFYDDRRSGAPYRSEYRDSRPFPSSSRRPISPSWRQRDRSPRTRRTPPPYRPRSRSRERRRPSSRSPLRRSPSPRKGSLSYRSRSRSPPRRRSPLSTRRSRSRSSSRSPRRSASPPKAVSRLPPIGAPTGPRLTRIAHDHPSYDPYLAAQYLPRETHEPRYAPTRSTASAPVEELELGQVEPEVAVRDEPMDVEPVKHEEDTATAAPAELTDPPPIRDVKGKTSESPIRSPFRRRSPSPAPPMAVHDLEPDNHAPSPSRSSPAPVKVESIQQIAKLEVKAEPSIPTRPRRFADLPPSRESNRIERASPTPRTETKYHWKGDRHDQYPSQSSPASSYHTKGSPHSPRPSFKAEERGHEPSKLSSTAHTPSIPAQELGGLATHSPRPHFDAPQLERAISSSEPGHSHKSNFIRMGSRTEHGNGPHHGRPPYAQRESTHNQKNEQGPPETIYIAADLVDFDQKHKQRMASEKESWSLSRQHYTNKLELDLALFDLGSAQCRTKLAQDMLGLAKTGKLGIDYPSHLSATWSEEKADVMMY